MGENATIGREKTAFAQLSCRVDISDLQVKSIQWKRNGQLMSNDSDKYTMASDGEASTLDISQPGDHSHSLTQVILLFIPRFVFYVTGKVTRFLDCNGDMFWSGRLFFEVHVNVGAATDILLLSLIDRVV